MVRMGAFPTLASFKAAATRPWAIPPSALYRVLMRSAPAQTGQIRHVELNPWRDDCRSQCSREHCRPVQRGVRESTTRRVAASETIAPAPLASNGANCPASCRRKLIGYLFDSVQGHEDPQTRSGFHAQTKVEPTLHPRRRQGLSSSALDSL